jgi:hypothetical protein
MCAEAGIEQEFEAFEQSLKGDMATALVTYFHKENLYLTDTRFRNQVNQMMAVLVAALTHSIADPQRTTDMDALQKIFQDEAKATRPRPGWQ